MPDGDVLNTDPPAPPAPADRKCVCEFCGCQLTPRGEVLKMGDSAKNFRRHEEIVESKDKEIRRLEGELSAAKAERDALKGAGSSGSARRVGSVVGS